MADRRGSPAPGLDLVDAEAGGDVSRVIVGGIAPPPGASVGARADWLARHGDGLRRLLLYPPHGEPTLSADLVVPPTEPAAEAGFIVMEAMGYPRFSGSNAMCTAAALLESGRLAPPDADTMRRVVLEAPGGPVALEVAWRDGRVESIDYLAEPAWVYARGRRATVPGIGAVTFDLVYGGVFFAVVDGARLGLDPARAGRDELAAFGAALVAAARPATALWHPRHGDAGPLSFVLVAGPTRAANGGREASVAVYVHPQVICHGPTGTGTAALLAWRDDGEALTTVSPEGRRFHGRVGRACSLAGRPALATVITGHPRVLGRRRVRVDPAAVEPALAALLDGGTGR